MTIGERIAQKRKELGLSQEALGEKMGVSRQSIYKWESDAALPEIEKLVNLSREFSVSVGWLLGEEDGAPERQELTPEQLAMVEEIVGRYLDARRAEEAGGPPEDGGGGTGRETQKKRRRWPWVLGAAAVLAVAAVFGDLFSRLDQMTQNYNNLQNSVNSISSNVGWQINSIAGRVEEVLQKQNDLTAEQSAKITDTDCRANTVTVSMRALPRTFIEGMTAEFLLESGGESFTVPGALGADHAFTGSATVPLSDDISVSVALISGEQRQTQFLNEFFDRYTKSFPAIDLLPGTLWGSGNKVQPYATLHVDPEALAQITSLRLGLFRDKKLVAWYEKLDEQPENFHGNFENTLFFRLMEEQTMEPGHVYVQAAVVVDQYGRERIYPGLPVMYDPDEDFAGHIEADGYYPLGTDPAGWEY